MFNRSLLLALMAAASSAAAQVTSSVQTIALTAVKSQSVTLSAPSPGTQSVTLVDGALNEFATTFSSTVNWSVNNSSSTTVKLVAYFANPAQALANGSDYLPSSLIEASTDGGSTWHALTSAAVGGVGASGGSFVLYTSPPTNGTARNGSEAVSFKLRINLTGGGSTYSGSYSGTLTLTAICN